MEVAPARGDDKASSQKPESRVQKPEVRSIDIDAHCGFQLIQRRSSPLNYCFYPLLSGLASRFHFSRRVERKIIIEIRCFECLLSSPEKRTRVISTINSTAAKLERVSITGSRSTGFVCSRVLCKLGQNERVSEKNHSRGRGTGAASGQEEASRRRTLTLVALSPPFTRIGLEPRGHFWVPKEPPRIDTRIM